MFETTVTVTTTEYEVPRGMEITGAYSSEYAKILTIDALSFIAQLHRRFNPRRLELLKKREERQAWLNEGNKPDFLPETKAVREGDWRCAAIPKDILDRRVEITGPVERKMIINALNSGAKVFMADFEDSNSPSWANCVEGQINLKDAILKTITYENPENGKKYSLNAETAVLFVRPRGWHLYEKNVTIDGEPVSGSIFDFGLYIYHNTYNLLESDSAPYFYLPKLESHLEARLWNDLFKFAQMYMGISPKSIKATVLIETILAAFEMDEILYELRDHSAGLNCGRWDYIFSYIKKFALHADSILPDRAQVTMNVPFMKSYCELVIQTCHKRGVHAMGGMAAQIPIKNDEEANQKAMDAVRADKEREVLMGHDGTWVAHPGLVQTAMDIFNEKMRTPNQIDRPLENKTITPSELLAAPAGTISERGIRENINIGILYTEYWLRGNGAAAIYNKMEDAATAEISRAQLWQWLHHSAITDFGQSITKDYYKKLIPEELEAIKKYVGEKAFTEGKFGQAVELFRELVFSPDFKDFLTLPAYRLI